MKPDPAEVPEWYQSWASEYCSAWMLPRAWFDSAEIWWPTFASRGATLELMTAAANAVRSGPAPKRHGDHLSAVLVALGEAVDEAVRRHNQAMLDARAANGPGSCEGCRGSGWFGPVPHPDSIVAGAFHPQKHVKGRPVYHWSQVTCHCNAGIRTQSMHRGILSLSEYERHYPDWRAMSRETGCIEELPPGDELHPATPTFSDLAVEQWPNLVLAMARSWRA